MHPINLLEDKQGTAITQIMPIRCLFVHFKNFIYFYVSYTSFGQMKYLSNIKTIYQRLCTLKYKENYCKHITLGL